MAKLNHELKGRDKGGYGKHTPSAPVAKSNKGLIIGIIIAVVVIAIAAVLIF